ncbi:MAG: hypothetical protein HQ522_15260 [Bacteroidetes bacterium]|nr:hypothetical protein [Bacteroidota bacterium]
MKKTLLIMACMLLLTAITPNLKAQEWDTGLDIYNTYVWRGTKFGAGPALQPYIEFSAGGFAIGAWGSYSNSVLAGDDDSFMEADLYASYGLDLGESGSLSFGLTDYYFPQSPYSDGKSHYIEPAITVGIGSFSLMGAYISGDGVSDTYIEAGLTAGPVDLTLAAGNGAYTIDGKFSLCNIGLSTSKEIKITESFSLPVSGGIIYNPSVDVFHIAVGISL